MKILFLQCGSYGQEDLEEAFIQEGHSLIFAPFSLRDKKYKDLPEVERILSEILLSEIPDLVFTVSYYPAISDFCNKKGIRYVSWSYDSPLDALYFESVLNPCNRIYMFDREICQEFNRAGISTLHYLPMAANTERLDRITANLPYIYDVSFVGALYLEGADKGNAYADRSGSLTDYTRGYVDGLVSAQLKIEGYNFIEEALGPVIEELRSMYPKSPSPGDLRSDEYYCAASVINPWITAVERIDLLEAIAGKYGMDFFTKCKEFTMPGLCNHGYVDYNTKMPQVFAQSRINLNISRRGMRSAVPLRCFDIMGSGGFLLSNFQSGFLDLFVPGKDFVYYESKEDLLLKIGYYLAHEEEREAIAKNGHDKIAAAHTYRHRVREMLDF